LEAFEDSRESIEKGTKTERTTEFWNWHPVAAKVICVLNMFFLELVQFVFILGLLEYGWMLVAISGMPLELVVIGGIVQKSA